ncbi:MAG: SHOCT domain-containing protein [Clostridiales bacterium]|nr:SHOCT domain-containing protein [Clostridiales bacterium]
MQIFKKIEKIFNWIVLGLAIMHLISYFMPIYKSVYTSSYDNTVETKVIYFYTSNASFYISYYIVNSISLLLPITAIIFLFTSFKNSKLFFLGLSSTYIANCIFVLLDLSKAIDNNTNTNNVYIYQYGYYFFIVTMVLFALAIIGVFVIHLFLKHKNLATVSEQTQQVTQDEKIDVIRKRIEVLDDLKTQGILTESEYEEKRAIIIKELKI